ncbi:hypothetical protein BDD12DRAFT_823991, partial [Trichophaea hybrida]
MRLWRRCHACFLAVSSAYSLRPRWKARSTRRLYSPVAQQSRRVGHPFHRRVNPSDLQLQGHRNHVLRALRSIRHESSGEDSAIRVPELEHVIRVSLQTYSRVDPFAVCPKAKQG